jgi:hypothetical protein
MFYETPTFPSFPYTCIVKESKTKRKKHLPCKISSWMSSPKEVDSQIVVESKTKCKEQLPSEISSLISEEIKGGDMFYKTPIFPSFPFTCIVKESKTKRKKHLPCKISSWMSSPKEVDSQIVVESKTKYKEQLPSEISSWISEEIEGGDMFYETPIQYFHRFHIRAVWRSQRPKEKNIYPAKSAPGCPHQKK